VEYEQWLVQLSQTQQAVLDGLASGLNMIQLALHVGSDGNLAGAVP
jgi:hypothetical protein